MGLRMAGRRLSVWPGRSALRKPRNIDSQYSGASFGAPSATQFDRKLN